MEKYFAIKIKPFKKCGRHINRDALIAVTDPRIGFVSILADGSTTPYFAYRTKKDAKTAQRSAKKICGYRGDGKIYVIEGIREEGPNSMDSFIPNRTMVI